MVIARKFNQFLMFAFLIVTIASYGQRIAIMGAMEQEIQMLTEDLAHKRIIEKGGITFYKGKLEGQKVVILKAGVGKVNSAYSSAILFENFNVEALIFTGVAGGIAPEIQPGDVVLAEQLVQYDFGKLESDQFAVWPFYPISDLQEKQSLYIKTDTNLLTLAKKALKGITLENISNGPPQFFTGTIATADTFVNSATKAAELYADYDALATEMEGAAVAQICSFRKIPFLVIRSCSDNANTNAHVDYQKFVIPAANNSAKIVRALLNQIRVPL